MNGYLETEGEVRASDRRLEGRGRGGSIVARMSKAICGVDGGGTKRKRDRSRRTR